MSSRSIRRLALCAALAFCGTALSACGGDDDKPVVKTEATSRGQQLIDLQRAHESGALTRKEYEREREKLLKEK